MADRNFEPQHTLGKGRVQLDFTIVPNGTDPPTIEEDYGKAVESVSRTGAGALQFVLKDKYKAVVSTKYQVKLNAAAASIVIEGANDVAGARTFALTVMTESAGSFAAADIAAHANNRIRVSLVLRNSTAGV